MGYTREQLKGFLRQAGWPESLVSFMASIGLAEQPNSDPYFVRRCPGNSYCVPGQRPEVSAGPWQINLLAHPEYSISQLVNPVNNARAALEIYRKQGARAWGSYTDGRYKQFLEGTGNDGGGGNFGAVPASNDSGIISRALGLDWLFQSIPSSAEKWAAVPKGKAVTGQQRYLLATAIVVLIIAFSWKSFS